MDNRFKKFLPLLLAAALSAPVMMAGCEVHGRVYDSYDHQYRQWAPESPYYRQWEIENHMRRERYERRNQEQQEQYWEWRHHQQHQRDRDDHHDRDDQYNRH